MQPHSMPALDRSTLACTFPLQRALRLHGPHGTSAQTSQSSCATPQRANRSGTVTSAILEPAPIASPTSGAKARGGSTGALPANKLIWEQRSSTDRAKRASALQNTARISLHWSGTARRNERDSLATRV